ncbi:MAG: hypothetical protein EPO39_08840 [Candidatus Manganitrophaceae bacterium]|nr:MAG: hypothetical protein EPO39_08840 [Candidatus Manganitrophaceae bacterium]
MGSESRKSQRRIGLSLSLIALLVLFGRELNAKDPAKFTVEMMTSEKGAIASKMWTVGTAIIITEPLSLSTPCDQIDGEVEIQRRKIFVKLKPAEKAPIRDAECSRKTAPAGVKVMIRDLPTGNFQVTLETPQRVTTENLLIDW